MIARAILLALAVPSFAQAEILRVLPDTPDAGGTYFWRADFDATETN